MMMMPMNKLLLLQFFLLTPYIISTSTTLAFQVNSRRNAEFSSHYKYRRGTTTQLSSSVSSSNSNNLSNLPSAYDTSLPASLRGEAVRSALKSDRGTCLDFTSPTFPGFNVGVVKVTGETVANFLNSKLSNTFPDRVVTTTSRDVGKNVHIEFGQVKEAGLVTTKGKIIDKLTVLSFGGDKGSSLEAYLMTSPGHQGSMLFDRLDPFIFPLDGVKLVDMCPSSAPSSSSSSSSRVFTVVATKIENVQSSIQQNVLPILNKWGLDCQSLVFPEKGSGECVRYSATNYKNEKMEFVLLEQTFLASCCCAGYTMVVSQDEEEGKSDFNIGSNIWENMVDENNFNGPVELGPLEYETLRIEAGVPRFGKEFTGGLKDDDDDDDTNGSGDGRKVFKANASPLELYLDHIVDESKGCYQGQEAIAAQLNNKRGVPRTLYSVIFPEEDNFYDDYETDEEEYSNHARRLSNKTIKPEAGADLYVLGSNQSIKVGTLTSVGEKDGTSSSETVALALVRRAEPILNKMNDMGLEIDVGNDMFQEDPFWGDDGYSSLSDEGGIIQPISNDPLDRLEVVLGGSFTQGYLRPIPSRRLQRGQNIFETEEWQSMDGVQDETGSVMGFIPENNSFDMYPQDEKEEEENKAQEKSTEEEEKLLEAKRKEEKMELLKQRAEEAMKRRREKQELAMNSEPQSTSDEEEPPAVTAAEAEAERKEAKMKLLKERAEAALKRRRQKNDESIN